MSSPQSKFALQLKTKSLYSVAEDGNVHQEWQKLIFGDSLPPVISKWLCVLCECLINKTLYAAGFDLQYGVILYYI